MKRKFYTDEHICLQAIDILNIAEDAIICLNNRWRVVLFNRGAEKLFGYKAEEILNQYIDILIPDEFVKVHRTYMEQFANGKSRSKSMNRRNSVYAKRKNGTFFSAQATISKIKTKDNTIFTAIIRDISRLESMKEKLQEVNNNLEQRVKERTAKLQEANTQLKKEAQARKKAQKLLEKEFQARLDAETERAASIQIVEKSSKLASIGVVAAGITHEINQPLNAIKITADGILFWEKRNKGVLPQRFIDKVKDISQGANRINEIIHHMRSFWDSQRNRDSKVNTTEVIQKALSLARAQMGSHGITLDYTPPQNDFYVKGNPIQLEQIIINLIVNAIHAVDASDKKNKSIALKTVKKKNYVQIQIIDNGTGFARGISQESLFDPFYSTKNGSGMGMGLGLAIVKYFVDKLDGKIRFFNNKLGGATFNLELPIYSC
ncbi:PAS domain-containing sensor histidine kinase [Candidatus Uabimicrobium amorphum]|uniref:histidine kinase n=1 Tax=Uabimicrobium amorphum TaxID=2596890 RepID=A0A5S9IPE6_UABAM|nr:PAS domain S-box protein [Candidatus Uabimicrobium amorphum]BBM85186.1 histidine kinase [Candidatus Uabimicrobium amorphum]